MFLFKKNKQEIEDTTKYRALNNEEILKYFSDMDQDGNCMISKNEWMHFYLKAVFEDHQKLEEEGPTAIMQYIETFSKEFDEIDLDENGYLDFVEYKTYIKEQILISE